MTEQLVKKILFVGGTGWLGNQVLNALLDSKYFAVKALIRKGTEEKKKEQVDTLRGKGAEIVFGDLQNIDELTKAAQGFDTIVSLLSGDALFEGQERNLIPAAKAAGVRRIVPSQFGADLDLMGRGTVLDVKWKFAQEIKKEGLDYTIILTGIFPEMWLSPKLGFDYQNGKYYLFGKGDKKLPFIFTCDVAKFVPEILKDPSSKNATVRLATDFYSENEVVQIFQEVGYPKKEVKYKSVEQIKGEMESAKMPEKMLLQLEYQILTSEAVNFSGKECNGKYPSVKTTSTRDWIKSLYQKYPPTK